jgi:dihydrofolate synthase / folylpolyglutamate synthase
MTYDEACRYLLTLGRELASPQHARAAKFDLANIRILADRLGNPERAVPAVHIAGTNGKGSTAAMLASILRAAGLRVGLYTSPHLVRINERIRLFAPRIAQHLDQHSVPASSTPDGDISDADFAATFTRVHDAIENLLATGNLPAHPTFFECVTPMAFDFFAREKPDIAVFEVGLGGRLDSTNILLPEVAVITQIAFDHENFLGHSLPEIAAEKAGIIKPGAWVVSAAGNPVAEEVIRHVAAQRNARLVDIDVAYSIADLRAVDLCYEFVVRRTAVAAHNAGAVHVSLPLAGRFQVRNAVTAIAAAHLLAERGFAIDDAAISQGLATVRWPGRIERVQERPAVYFDGTHNPAGARELAAFWKEHLAGRRIHLVYGAMRDKAVDEVAGLLFPQAATVILTQSPQPRAISASVLASITRHLAHALEVIPDPGAALRRALDLAAPDDVVFVTGSLFIVGDLHRYWATHAASSRNTEDASLSPAPEQKAPEQNPANSPPAERPRFPRERK